MSNSITLPYKERKLDEIVGDVMVRILDEWEEEQR